jgi:hypothetical protein
MNDVNYPRWMQRWNDKAEEIDERIIGFFRNAGKETEELFENIKLWLNGGSTAAYATEPQVYVPGEAKTADSEALDLERFADDDPQYETNLRDKIQERVDELEEAGRIGRYRAEAGGPEERVVVPEPAEA